MTDQLSMVFSVMNSSVLDTCLHHWTQRVATHYPSFLYSNHQGDLIIYSCIWTIKVILRFIHFLLNLGYMFDTVSNSVHLTPSYNCVLWVEWWVATIVSGELSDELLQLSFELSDELLQLCVLWVEWLVATIVCLHCLVSWVMSCYNCVCCLQWKRNFVLISYYHWISLTLQQCVVLIVYRPQSFAAPVSASQESRTVDQQLRRSASQVSDELSYTHQTIVFISLAKLKNISIWLCVCVSCLIVFKSRLTFNNRFH